MAENTMQRTVVVNGTGSSTRQEIQVGPFSLVADVGPELGGKDTAPNAYDLLMASLGACTSMTIGHFARLKGIQVDSIRVTLNHASVYASECQHCETKSGTIEKLTREIELVGPLSEDQRQFLLAMARKCPVSQVLTHQLNHEVLLVTELVPSASSTGPSATA